MYDRNLKAAKLAYQKALSLATGRDVFVSNLKLANVNLLLASTQADIGVDYVQLLQEGIAHVKQAILLNNESAAAYLVAGKLFLASNEVELAQYALKRALVLDPKQPLTNLTLYKLYYATQNWVPAEQHLWNEYEVQPMNPHVLYCLSVFALESNAYGEALKLAQRCVRLEPWGKGWNIIEQLRSVWDIKEEKKKKPPTRKK
jgi:tetratricopeptide (TPR) repeat protein